MKISNFLEEFSANEFDQNNDSKIIAVEEDKLESFEQGYKAGWDDALAAQTEIETQNVSKLNQAISDLSFNQYSALDTASRHTTSLFREILDIIFPKMINQMLQNEIIFELNKALKVNLAPEIKIFLNKEQIPRMQKFSNICKEEGILVEAHPDIDINCAKAVTNFNEVFIDLNKYTDRISELLQIHYSDDIWEIHRIG